MTQAGALRAIGSMATRQLLAELFPGFAQHSGWRAQIESVAGVDAARRVRAGEAFDAVLLASDAIDALLACGHLLPGSKRDWLRSPVALALRAGAPLPGLESEAALRQLLLAAPSIALSSGPSGAALQRLFAAWGLADALAPRLVRAAPGVPVGALVASGAAAIGFQQLSELLPVAGIRIAGPLPGAARISTVFSGAIGARSRHAAAARALLDFLAAPAAQQAKRRQGMEPA